MKMEALIKLLNEENDNLRQIAQKTLEQANGVREDAVKRFIDIFYNDRAMLERNLYRILVTFARDHITLVAKSRRLEEPAMMNVVPINGNQFNAAVQANFERYISRPIWGGKAIGDCTGAEIRESASRYEKQGSTLLRESAWQTSVAEALEKNRKTPEETVSAVLAESDLAILWDANDD